jgi:hypothetical protein
LIGEITIKEENDQTVCPSEFLDALFFCFFERVESKKVMAVHVQKLPWMKQ